MGDGFPKRRRDINVGIVDGETVVLDRSASVVHQLNRTATYIWEHCDGKTSVANLARQLTEVFDVSSAVAREDVESVISKLSELNLFEPE